MKRPIALNRAIRVSSKNELGDLLFQIVFYAQLANEQKLFDFNDIVTQLNAKLTRRHPHVFDQQTALSDDELAAQWQAIKAQERSAKSCRSLHLRCGKIFPLICQA